MTALPATLPLKVSAAPGLAGHMACAGALDVTAAGSGRQPSGAGSSCSSQYHHEATLMKNGNWKLSCSSIYCILV